MGLKRNFRDIVKHESAGGYVFYESTKRKRLYVALVQKKNGAFFIPKGHMKTGETTEEASLREILEELTLTEIPLRVGSLGTSNYTFKMNDDTRSHSKDVHLFVYTLPRKAAIRPCKEEDFIGARWVEFSEALNLIEFDQENLKRAKDCYQAYRGTRHGFTSISRPSENTIANELKKQAQ